ncbi:MAG TPA: rRNA pseudouridine synthase [Planctomycetes bacterium]|nr:rRNA pseudouridine synthase [Planctomycetota bacterium]
MRLAHFLSRAGIASRRNSEEIVRAGGVAVNGRVVTDPAFGVDERSDKVAVHGRRVVPPLLVYYLLHKPKGVVSSANPQGRRRTVFDLVPPEPRVFAAGRLDTDSSGLLLLTNDGDFVEKLTHPRYEVPKTYRVNAEGELTDAALSALKKGIWLAEGKMGGQFRVVRKGRGFAVLDVTITQGVNRQVRRMLAKVGLKVRSLMRTHFGPFRLGKLPPGAFRVLKSAEARAAVDVEKAAPRRSDGDAT